MRQSATLTPLALAVSKRPAIVQSIPTHFYRNTSNITPKLSDKNHPSMDEEEFRKSAHAAIEDIIQYFSSLPNLPVTARIAPGYLRPLLPTAAPQHSEPWPTISSDISSKIMPGLTHWQSPRFMAFFPATVTYPSILGEMYSAAFTAPAFNWICSPACTELETVVLDWVAKMLGLPEVFHSEGGNGGGGVIQGSASEALLTCMIAARDRYLRKVLAAEGLEERKDETEEEREKREDRAAEIRGRMVVLATEQAHSSAQKAANILGIRYRSVRAGRETQYRMTGQALRAKLDQCRKQGLVPFFCNAMLGTTSTCAVDELDEMAEIKKEQPDLWFHIDGAYAGAALICEEFREISKSKWLGEFDSFNFNMHKWLLVNFDASILYIRSRHDLTAALSITPSYLINPSNLTGLVTDYRDWQIPLGRRFRALKIWFVIRSYGIEGMQAYIRKGVALGEFFARMVREREDLFELVDGPRFGLSVIRCKLLGEHQAEKQNQSNGAGTAHTNGANGETPQTTTNSSATDPSPPSLTQRNETEMNDFGRKKQQVASSIPSETRLEAANALTKKVYETVNERGEIFLTGSLLDGVYTIRVVSANERAEEKYVKRAFAILVDVTEELRDGF